MKPKPPVKEKPRETREEFVARMHQKSDTDPEAIWKELAEIQEGNKHE